MAVRRHNKLVRTKVPRIIRDKGEECCTFMVAGQDLSQELIKKLREEAEEVAAAVTNEELASELADLSEVLEAIETHHNSPHCMNSSARILSQTARTVITRLTKLLPESLDVAAIQEKKRQERGGFLLEDGRGVFLSWTSEAVRIAAPLVEVGLSNRSGRIYTEECVEQMQKQLQELIKNRRALIADKSVDGSIQLDSVYGELDHIGMEEEDGRKKLMAKGRIFTTPMGLNLIESLQEYRKEGETTEETFNRLFVMCPSGIGSLTDGNIVDPTTYRFVSANIFPRR